MKMFERILCLTIVFPILSCAPSNVDPDGKERTTGSGISLSKEGPLWVSPINRVDAESSDFVRRNFSFSSLLESGETCTDFKKRIEDFFLLYRVSELSFLKEETAIDSCKLELEAMVQRDFKLSESYSIFSYGAVKSQENGILKPVNGIFKSEADCKAGAFKVVKSFAENLNQKWMTVECSAPERGGISNDPGERALVMTFYPLVSGAANTFTDFSIPPYYDDKDFIEFKKYLSSKEMSLVQLFNRNENTDFNYYLAVVKMPANLPHASFDSQSVELITGESCPRLKEQLLSFSEFAKDGGVLSCFGNRLWQVFLRQDAVWYFAKKWGNNGSQEKVYMSEMECQAALSLNLNLIKNDLWDGYELVTGFCTKADYPNNRDGFSATAAIVNRRN